MSRYVDVDELHSRGWVASRYINWEPTPFNDNFRLEVEVKPLITFPAADVVEVRHGKWIDLEFAPYNLFYTTCSVCGHRQTIEATNYCPNCGARMDEVEE